MKKILFLLAFAITLGISAQSCREMGIDPWDKGKGNENPMNSNNLSIDKLVGTKWQLVSIEGSKQMTVPNGKLISLIFDSKTLANGLNLCNEYGASIISNKTGEIDFEIGLITLIACAPADLHSEYHNVLNKVQNYSATEKELRLYFDYGHLADGTGQVLVFAPLIDEGGSGGEIDIRVQQMVGQTYTLYSFENAGVEEILTDSKNCTIEFVPKVNSAKGYANIQAECNKGKADLTFSADFDVMKLDNFSLTEIACQNQMTADRFVEFLKNTAHFEYSDYGSTLTIWSSLLTFGESKMVLKVAPIPIEQTIEIQDTPTTGVPFSTYPSFMLLDRKFDGKYIQLFYQYIGQSDDYQISAYSLFEFNLSMPPTVVIDLVTDGTINQTSNNTLTQSSALLSLDAIRNRITIGNPGTVKMNIVLRWNGMDMGSIGQLEVQL